MRHTISAPFTRKKLSLTAVVINFLFEKAWKQISSILDRPVLQLSIKPIYPYINLVINTVSYWLSNIMIF